jgi:hypothetical protein
MVFNDRVNITLFVGKMKKTYEACLQTHILSPLFHVFLCLVGSLAELCPCKLDVLLHLLLYFFDIEQLGHLLP